MGVAETGSESVRVTSTVPALTGEGSLKVMDAVGSMSMVNCMTAEKFISCESVSAHLTKYVCVPSPKLESEWLWLKAFV
jgi:hypothetical protein